VSVSSDRLVWFKGDLVSSDEVMIRALSPTAQYGLNAFEGIRAYWSAEHGELFVFRLADHLVRLGESCTLLGLVSPYSKETLEAHLLETIRANDFREDIALRLTLFVDGEGSWRSSEPVEMFIAPIPHPRKDLGKEVGLTACISTWERISDNAMPPRAKVGANYINGRYGHIEAQRNGYDLAIFMGSDGKVSEGAGACLFLVRRGRLITPPTTGSILESITRASLLELAGEMDIETAERPVDRTELYLAEEVFLCGSSAEVTPIQSVDGHRIGDGAVGPVTTAVHQRYLEVATSGDPRFSGWLTRVYHPPS